MCFRPNEVHRFWELEKAVIQVWMPCSDISISKFMCIENLAYSPLPIFFVSQHCMLWVWFRTLCCLTRHGRLEHAVGRRFLTELCRTHVSCWNVQELMWHMLFTFTSTLFGVFRWPKWHVYMSKRTRVRNLYCFFLQVLIRCAWGVVSAVLIVLNLDLVQFWCPMKRSPFCHVSELPESALRAEQCSMKQAWDSLSKCFSDSRNQTVYRFRTLGLPAHVLIEGSVRLPRALPSDYENRSATSTSGSTTHTNSCTFQNRRKIPPPHLL